jgi:hypothetical protein
LGNEAGLCEPPPPPPTLAAEARGDDEAGLPESAAPSNVNSSRLALAAGFLFLVPTLTR